MRLWTTILHPTDFSKVSDAAFVEAVRLAGHTDAELVLLHVLTWPSAYELQTVGWPSLYRLDALERRGVAEVELRRLVSLAERRGARGRAMLVEGVPAREIVTVAASIRADLVVMGTHDSRLFDRLLFGDTASRVVRAACCPVLTVRPPASEHRAQPATTHSYRLSRHAVDTA